jgi:mono/diheme cytochrome c family protein
MPVRSRPATLLAPLLIGLGCLVSAPEISGSDDVPPEIAQRENPVSLPEDRVRYFARQFKAKCARCHGIDGDGAGKEASGQAVPPRDFTDPAYMESRTDGQLFYQILVGGGTRCAMPAFGPGTDHSWTEEKIWYMVGYVRRFARPTEP